MPRGDGRKEFEPRPHRKRLNLPQYVPEGLAIRIGWWNTELKETFTPKDKHDGKGNSFRKPGSQKK